MKLLSVAYYSLIRNVKDLKTLFIIIGGLVLIVILGISTDQFYAPLQLEQAEIAFFSDDRGAAAVQFEEFLAHEKFSELLNIQPVDSYDAGAALLNDGQVEAFLYLPAGFSGELDQGTGASITLFSSSRHSFVKSLVENYLNMVNAASAARATCGEAGDITGQNNHIEPVALTTDGKVPRAIDYYAVQTLLQVLIFGATFGIAAIREDEEKNTLVRIKSAPVRPSDIIAGRTLANILSLSAAALIVVAFSILVYRANWGGSMAVNLSVLFIFIVLVTGMGMLLGIVIRNPGTANALLVVLLIYFSAAGGAISKYMTEGPIGQILAKSSPNYYAATAIFNNIFTGSAEQVRFALLVLLAITLGIYLVVLLTGRRRYI